MLLAGGVLNASAGFSPSHSRLLKGFLCTSLFTLTRSSQGTFAEEQKFLPLHAMQSSVGMIYSGVECHVSIPLCKHGAWLLCVSAVNNETSLKMQSLILTSWHCWREKKRSGASLTTYLNVMISAASSSSSFPLWTRWMSNERLPERPGTASLVDGDQRVSSS